jgi:prepilin-type N-terminal cleavage/methylation domain-containing protein
MRRSAFTLIELLIAVGIIGLLLQASLPAIEMSREAARRTHCGNNMRQIGLAVLQHEVVHRRYPSGGWHFTWIGEPERGTDIDQPGSWAFNLLPYLEEGSLRDMGSGLSGEARTRALIMRSETPLSVFICPSRRLSSVYWYTYNQLPFTKGGRLLTPLRYGAKSDYAVNVGDSWEVEFDWQWKGPQSLEEGDGDFEWPRETIKKFTGVVYGRSRVEIRQITDGLSKTYLVGEKYVNAKDRKTGEDVGDNESLYVGFNNDTCRSAFATPEHDSRFSLTPNIFGSSHPTVWQVVFCDGSVGQMSYDIDPELHKELANKSDGIRQQPSAKL